MPLLPHTNKPARKIRASWIFWPVMLALILMIVTLHNRTPEPKPVIKILELEAKP